MKAAFPGFDADVHCDLPSGSVLSRRQLVVDCAFACFWRQLLADHDGCLYLWADSSPQGGVDWLLSIIVLIKRENLEEVAEAADALQGSAERFVAACELDDTHAMMQIAQQRHACGLVLTKGMQRHRQIPMALGSGRSSLEHKVRCICQKFYAESQSLPALKKNLGRVRSVCTDMGTEMGLPQMEGASLESLIPSYMLEDAGLFSEEAAGQAEHCANFLLPEALLAPGILHIVHNMMKDTDSNLSFWKTWIPGLKAIAKLLHEDHLRQRLVATCIKGTPFEWLEEHFQKGVPQPIEWRWGTVTAIVEHVLSVRSAIQAIWNPAVFGKGESEERERTEGADALNVDTITEAVRLRQAGIDLGVEASDIVEVLDQYKSFLARFAEVEDMNELAKRFGYFRNFDGSFQPTQEDVYEKPLIVRTSDGLKVTLELEFVFRLQMNNLRSLYMLVGAESYQNTLVHIASGTIAAHATNFSAQAFYGDRGGVASAFQEALTQELAQRLYINEEQAEEEKDGPGQGKTSGEGARQGEGRQWPKGEDKWNRQHRQDRRDKIQELINIVGRLVHRLEDAKTVTSFDNDFVMLLREPPRIHCR
ncbi:hypothetical protein AK812_SmicGene42716 [Symbiodinium microadriaticum]|uniref:Band 7 domain-containing protein n=1 Tax=Symbiodinium microadriaticum TaxID=2951 RepID=A0A1Q9C2V1_SYMMI|nr:hypothetical protein AK812_SmicGene42716 [Symbiodinium microadriaticum]